MCHNTILDQYWGLFTGAFSCAKPSYAGFLSLLADTHLIGAEPQSRWTRAKASYSDDFPTTANL